MFRRARERLVERLKSLGYIRSDRVAEAMLKVPRHEFVPEHLRDRAYVDSPLPIGKGQTISAPHMVAMMTELLDPRPGHKVLEVGAGSGYHAAVVAELVKPDGKVITVERIPELAEFARENLRRTGYDKWVEVVVGDGTLGYPEEAPYDRILVTAGAPDVPRSLFEQLKPGGRMVIPVGDRHLQELWLIRKTEDGRMVRERHGGCAFVPLIGKEGFRE
ncbi:MAG: protein-L-isoaspartate(D-aspartate) O-methyltransferase [Methanopyri archaeon]|nr:protein-L-isoaspartate(D-aspartate) O-methyltransferase [Methanopyri archaeon]